eukprot:UN13717
MTSYQSQVSIEENEVYDDQLLVEPSTRESSNMTSLLTVPTKDGKPTHKSRKQNVSKQQANTDLKSSDKPCCIVL